MNNEAGIATRIVAEMMHYFYQHHIYELQIDAKLEADCFLLTVRGTTDRPHPEMDDFCAELNTPRLPELETYYNQLLGLNEQFCQIRLLSSMIDKAELEKGDGYLSIRIVRKLHGTDDGASFY